MQPSIDGPAPSVYADEIPTLNGLSVNHTISVRLKNMEFVKANNADFVELWDRNCRVRSASTSRREQPVDLQNNTHIIRDRVGTYQNKRSRRLTAPEVLDFLLGIDRAACNRPATYPNEPARTLQPPRRAGLAARGTPPARIPSCGGRGKSFPTLPSGQKSAAVL